MKFSGRQHPWPLAEIVYQHHENLDGSGYPRQLSGDAILLEARILRVCDIVEAMSSHRAFRPAVGLKRALDELRQMSGKQRSAGGSSLSGPVRARRLSVARGLKNGHDTQAERQTDALLNTWSSLCPG